MEIASSSSKPSTAWQPADRDASDTPPRIRWSIVLGIFAASFVLRFAYFYLDDLTRQAAGTLVRRLLEEGTGHVTSLLLFPLVLWVERRFPLDRARWRRTWGAHVAAYAVYSALHTSLIALSRAALFPALGHGHYDYGLLSLRYVMESAQDVFSYLTIVGILTAVRVRHRLRQRELRAVELERDAANARLAALSARLQPHFLFNALNTISSAAYDDPAAADDMIGRLGVLLRHALGSSDRPEVRVDEEVALLRAYVSFVEARFGDRLSVRITVTPDTPALAMPGLLLQPLVENAVRHGSALESVDSEILIDVARRDDWLVVTVENDVEAGSGNPAPDGVGLGTTRDRLRLLYGAAASLDASVDGGRFRVVVRLPARELPPANASVSPLEYARADR